MSDENEQGEGSADELATFDASLRSSAVWAVTPHDLGPRIAAAIASERASERAIGLPSGPTATGRRRSTLARVLLPVAAGALLAFAAGVLIGRAGDSSPAVDDVADAAATVTLAGTDLAPGAIATGAIFDKGAGYSIRLRMEGLAPAPSGEYYEGWLRSDDGDLVSVGTFHMRNGDGTVVLWSGVAVDDYPTLLVTAQTEGDPVSSDAVVLSGPVT